MSSEPPTDGVVIRARGLGKCYHVYKQPKDRLMQYLRGRRRRYYREFWANQDIDLEVRAGETLGIVGRNGAGKTTLLQMIAGTLFPSAGTLDVHGRVTALLELGSGFEREFTGRENVFLSGAVLGVPQREMEERFDEIAAFADIGEFLDQPVKTYSKGMFVRLSFAVLASLDPDIFVVDEALAVGDAYFRQRCMRRFHEMRERGTTILYVSHDGGAMKRLCDRVAWIDGGKLVDVGSPAGVVESYLNSVFGKPVAQGKSQPSSSNGSEDDDTVPRHEGSIPNVDQRLGDQSLSIVGVGLYSPAGSRLVSIDHGMEVVFRMSVENRSCDPGTNWVAGYILRNGLGEDVSSTNTLREDLRPDPLDLWETRTIRARFRLPLLPPGPYTLVPTVAREEDDGRLVVTDQVDAALVFHITGARKVTSMLALETRYDLEDDTAWSGDPPAAGEPEVQSSSDVK